MYEPCISHTLKCLNRNGALVQHQVDATKLGDYRELLGGEEAKFDRIVWNFPHGGFPEAEEDHHGPGFEWTDSFLKKHSSLVQAFLE